MKTLHIVSRIVCALGIVLTVFAALPARADTTRQLDEFLPWEIEWRPDGTMLALTTREEAWLYTADGEPMTELPVDDGQDPFNLAWSPDGSKLAVGTVSTKDLDKTYIWQVDADGSFSLLRTIQEGQPVYARIAWNPDSTQLVTTWLNELRIWDVTTGTRLKTLRGPELPDGFRYVAWSPDSVYLAAGAHPNLYIWNMITEERVVLPQTNPIRNLAWAPNSRQLAAVNAKSIYIWTYNDATASFEHTHTLQESTLLIFGLDWQGDILASSGESHYIYLWDAVDWQLREILPRGGKTKTMHAMALSPDAAQLAYVGLNRELTIKQLH